MTSDKDLVQQLWGLCHILRDDGITYHQYVNELTYLLFLKIAEERGTQASIPENYRWSDLSHRKGDEQYKFYLRQLVELGASDDESVRTIFANPTSLLRHAESLNILVERINALDWYRARQEGLGDIYEGLLEKNASEKKSGAGQYFTPRPLIEAIVRVLQPRCNETIQDPAAGTGGFLIVANEFAVSTKRKRAKCIGPRFFAAELVQDVHRLLLMNAILHEMDGEFMHEDTLSISGAERLPAVDVILTNPPFGNKRGGALPSRRDLPYPTANKQLAFLQHVYLGLKPGGRAAVVVPDNVLFEGNVGHSVRMDLLDRCDLHTILRLPDGIFYANVRTNVLFFSRPETPNENGTNAVWIYDLRTSMPIFGKRTPLRSDVFDEFVHAYGDDPLGRGPRSDMGPHGRFRQFTRAEIIERDYNLDVTWLKDRRTTQTWIPTEPEQITAEIRLRLEGLLEELDALQEQIIDIDAEAAQ